MAYGIYLMIRDHQYNWLHLATASGSGVWIHTCESKVQEIDGVIQSTDVNVTFSRDDS